MSESTLIDESARGYNTQSRSATATTTTEYAEFDFEDASHESDENNHHQPLLSNIDSEDNNDEESILDSPEQKQYKLPSEGGTIFSSFVNIILFIISNVHLNIYIFPIFLLAQHGKQHYRSRNHWIAVCI